LTLAQATDVAERPKSRTASILGRPRYRTLLDLLIVAATALALRLPAVGFGLPTMLQSDEPGNINVGAKMAADWDLDPHYFAYPSVLYDVEALADLAARLLTGHMLIAYNSFATQGMGINRTADPHIVLGLRLITVAASVAICLLVYGVIVRITRRRWVAVGCGLLAATSPLLVTNGVFVTPDTYSALTTAAALAGALVVVRRGTRRDYVLAGIAVGFAVGSKYDVAAVLPVVAAYVLREGRDAWRPRPLRQLGLAMAAAAAGFALTTPAVLFDTGSVYRGLTTQLTAYSTGHPGEQGGSLGYYLSALLHDQPVLLPGVVLAIVAASYGRFRKEIVVTTVFALANFILIARETVRFDRDLLPLLPALILLNGFAVAWVAELVARRWPETPPRAGRLAVVTAVVVAALIPAVIGAAGVPETLDEAPRTEAAAWLEAHLPRGATVVNENYGPWLNTDALNLVHVTYVLAVTLPVAHPQAIILTDEGSGRFMGDPTTYPAQAAVYKSLLARYCISAKFTNGPWVEVLTPCG
jgi:Dolichyl-phosphate-mannose-protein mannosyltransferase